MSHDNDIDISTVKTCKSGWLLHEEIKKKLSYRNLDRQKNEIKSNFGTTNKHTDVNAIDRCIFYSNCLFDLWHCLNNSFVKTSCKQQIRQLTWYILVGEQSFNAGIAQYIMHYMTTTIVCHIHNY